MGAFFTWLLAWFRRVASLILPFLDRARSSSMLGPGVRWTIHVVLVLLILVGLHYLNQYLGYDTKLPGHSRLVAENWLPILFLLVYALGWLGWWLWKLLVVEREAPEFPDITDAWEAARGALARSGLDITRLPIFLVLGRPETQVESLFEAARLKYLVRGAPHSDAPLQVYATNEAIFVTTVGCSVLGEYSAQLAGASSSSGQDFAPPSEGGGLDTLGAGGPTAAPDAVPGVSEIQKIMQRAYRENRPMTREEKRHIRMLTRQDRSFRSCVRNADEVARLTARFEALCHLIVGDRWPYVPINGIMVLIPLAATDTEQDALDAGSAVQQDLTTAQRVLQVRCPVISLVCDVETAPGFTEFFGRFPARDRNKRVGNRSPMVPHLETRPGRPEKALEARAEMLESLASWVCEAVPLGWVNRLFRLEEPGRGEEVDTIMRGNGQLFLFLNDMRQRHPRLGQVLARGFISEDGEPPFYGGCYLGATGPSRETEQAWVAGAFQRIMDEESKVTWTDQALVEEAGYQRAAAIAQVVLGVLVLAGLGLAGLYFFGSKKM